MKTKEYAISIQWGGGIHYFVAYASTLIQAGKIALSRSDMLDQRGQKRGAKPTVHIWKEVSFTR